MRWSLRLKRLLAFFFRGITSIEIWRLRTYRPEAPEDSKKFPAVQGFVRPYRGFCRLARWPVWVPGIQ